MLAPKKGYDKERNRRLAGRDKALQSQQCSATWIY